MKRFPKSILLALFFYALFPIGVSVVEANALERELGRNDSRVYSEGFPLREGISVVDSRLAERLDRLGYSRVREKPSQPGEYFWGFESFWIYRRAHRTESGWKPASLLGFVLDKKNGTILGAKGKDDALLRLPSASPVRLEPELLAESIDGTRAPRKIVPLEKMPEFVWRALLAAEDSRFFDHGGVDTRALARAAIKNAKAGGVTQGGSTLTQQLVKQRELSPKRTLGRKISEAARALHLEAEFKKETILEAYLNQVYFGHVNGTAIHGIEAGAQAYLSKSTTELTLAEAAQLIGMVQGPNRLHPGRNPEAAMKRRNYVLKRLEEEGWASSEAVASARQTSVGYQPTDPRSVPAQATLAWIAEQYHEEKSNAAEEGRGVVAWTTLDPILQTHAEEVVADALSKLKQRKTLKTAPVGVALVAVDRNTGAVLAHVGGDPREIGFDRARKAARQPGSTVKPFVMLEALEDCGRSERLTLATLIADRPVTVIKDDQQWQPVNPDQRFEGPLSLKEALIRSRNVPTVRVAAACGFEEVADRFKGAGLTLPENPPPSFILGAVETTPLELAQAYTVLAGGGVQVQPYAWTSLQKPGGGWIERNRSKRDRVASAESAWLIESALQEVARSGTGEAAAIPGFDVAVKTGTTNDRKDAWLAGWAGSVVAVVWVGRDDGAPLGLTGATAAAPLWKSFMEVAAKVRPKSNEKPPRRLTHAYIQPERGWSLKGPQAGAIKEWFIRGTIPPKKRWWRKPKIGVLEMSTIRLDD